jgi:hypothetical protein
MTRFLWLVLSCLLWAVSAQAQAPFYQGKTIRIIVGTPPGNLYDFLGAADCRSYGSAYSG